MLSNFRGTLAGALVGDCLGLPYEGDEVPKKQLQQYFDKIEGPPFKSMYLSTLSINIARNLFILKAGG